jgi:hypothetical protein
MCLEFRTITGHPTQFHNVGSGCASSSGRQTVNLLYELRRRQQPIQKGKNLFHYWLKSGNFRVCRHGTSQVLFLERILNWANFHSLKTANSEVMVTTGHKN